jgi:hypothetical protein
MSWKSGTGFPKKDMRKQARNARPLRQTTARTGLFGLAVHPNVICPPLAAGPSFEE